MNVHKNLKFMQGLLVGLMTVFIFIVFDTYSQRSASYMLDMRLTQESTDTGAGRIQLQDDQHVHNDDSSVARELSEKVRVLIAIMTAPKNLNERAQAVKDTWGKRCGKNIIYFSTEENSSFPTTRLNVPEGYDHLTAKTMTGFKYMYDHYFHDFDWFMKADDDTYVIVENLRYFLAAKNSSEPVYFGHHFRPYVKQGYHGGGAGYVLSKESMRRYGQKMNTSGCKEDGGAEDVAMGRCLQNLGVHIINSTDSLGRSRFHSFTPERHLSGEFPRWYYSYDVQGSPKGRETMSDYVISFHKVIPNHMRLLDFFVYHLRPYGIFNGNQSLNVNSTATNGNSTSTNGSAVSVNKV